MTRESEQGRNAYSRRSSLCACFCLQTKTLKEDNRRKCVGVCVCVCVCVCVPVCLSVCHGVYVCLSVCLSIASDSFETFEVIIITFGTVTASDMIMHLVLIRIIIVLGGTKKIVKYSKSRRS